jgi:hypothetical protein
MSLRVVQAQAFNSNPPHLLGSNFTMKLFPKVAYRRGAYDWHQPRIGGWLNCASSIEFLVARLNGRPAPA